MMVLREENLLSICWIHLIRLYRFPIFAFKWLIYEKIGVYGTSPARIALSMLVVLGAFSILYLPFPPKINPSNAAPVFHSVITFLTIGYGTDYINLNFWGKLLSGIEGFLGLFLMSYFTIAFVRKVLR